MIATLSGTVRSLTPDRAIIEVGGVGMNVLINAHTSNSLTVGAHANLFTTLVVREDSLTLFGFSDEASRVLFELVQTVSGIGRALHFGSTDTVGVSTGDKYRKYFCH